LLTLGNVLAREMIPQQTTVFAVSPNGPIHSDFYPELEYMAQRGFFLNRTSDQWQHFREDFTPRSTTWFGTYLQKYPLDEEDFQAFAVDYRHHRTPEPRLFRSLLLRWQGDAPRPAFPLDLWVASSEQIHTAELRVLRLAPQLEGMLQEAAADPLPLRVYAVDLMANYRSQRSIFYLPPAIELDTVLERLLETDPAHQRIYRLYQAELAWDRGQDVRCLELGQIAFDPDVAKGGPVDFSLDLYAPCAVLYRMIESLWRSGRVPHAWALCQQAAAGGYVANSGSVFPLLHVSYRRVEAAVAQMPGPQAQP
jgi:hypothetical protein